MVIADAVQDMDLTVVGQRYKRSRSVAERGSRTVAAVANIHEWYGVASDGGPQTLRAAIRSDGSLLLPPLSSAPSVGVAAGQLYHRTSASGGTELWQYDGLLAAFRRMLRRGDLDAIGNFTSSRQESMSRDLAQNVVSTASGQVLWTCFTALDDLTITQIEMVSGTTAASGLTLARMGLCTVDSSNNLTLVARTASDTTLFAATASLYSRPLDTTGGYPASYQLQRGQRYAFAVIQVGTTVANYRGSALSAAAMTTLSPFMAASLSAQTDIPTAAQLAAGGVGATGSRPWMAAI